MSLYAATMNVIASNIYFISELPDIVFRFISIPKHAGGFYMSGGSRVPHAKTYTSQNVLAGSNLTC